jgi:ribosomal-protein-alanine N-acetyltransferase
MEEKQIQKMKREDIPAVARLEREIFSDPWSAEALTDTLSQPRTLAWVLREQEQLAGYFLGSYVLDEAEVYRIAVAAEYRRKGFGARLMERFLSESEKLGVTVQMLEVRGRNRAAIELYKGFGFAAEGLRKNYYRDPADDAVQMARRTGSNSR